MSPSGDSMSKSPGLWFPTRPKVRWENIREGFSLCLNLRAACCLQASEETKKHKHLRGEHEDEAPTEKLPSTELCPGLHTHLLKPQPLAWLTVFETGPMRR